MSSQKYFIDLILFLRAYRFLCCFPRFLLLCNTKNSVLWQDIASAFISIFLIDFIVTADTGVKQKNLNSFSSDIFVIF